MEPLLTTTSQLLYNGQAPRSQMNSLCTKQPLNKGHLCIKAKTLFPKGVRYRGFHCNTVPTHRTHTSTSRFTSSLSCCYLVPTHVKNFETTTANDFSSTYIVLKDKQFSISHSQSEFSLAPLHGLYTTILASSSS